ncbi:unnamed protein product [Penicillium pancosmium]
MVHDGLGQLVPQKRSLDNGELSIHLKSKAQCLSGHAKNLTCSKSSVNCQSTAVQEDSSGRCDASWPPATGVASITSINETEAIARDEPGSEDQACPELSSPGLVEVCYGSIPDVSVEFRDSLPIRSDSVTSSEDIYILEVLPGPDYFVICAPSADEMIGFINLKDSNTLKALQHIGKIRLEIALNSSECGALQQGFMRPFTRTVEVTIFGMFSIAEDVDVSESESESEDCRTRNSSIENTPTNGMKSPTEGFFCVMNDLDQHEQISPFNADPRLTVELLQ